MTLEDEPTDEELLTIYSSAEGDSSYDGWLALWRAGRVADPSPEEIEAAAKVLFSIEEPDLNAWRWNKPQLGVPDPFVWHDYWLNAARAALLAARDVRNTKETE